MAQTVKRLPITQETQVQSLGWEDLLEKEMATHSSILGWKIPWMVEPGRLQSMGSQRDRNNWATSLLSLLFLINFPNMHINTSLTKYRKTLWLKYILLFVYLYWYNFWRLMTRKKKIKIHTAIRQTTKQYFLMNIWTKYQNIMHWVIFERRYVFKVVKEKNLPNKNTLSANLSFKMEKEIRTFQKNQKLSELVTTSLAL